MSARSKARKHSLDILYEADIRKSDPLAIIETRLSISDDAELPPVRDYTKELVTGVAEHKRKIDELIATYIQGWDLDYPWQLDLARALVKFNFNSFITAMVAIAFKACVVFK